MAFLHHGKGIAIVAHSVAGAGDDIVRVKLFFIGVNAKGDLTAYCHRAADILLQPDGLAVLHVVYGILECLIVGTVNLSRWADIRLQSEGAEPVTGGKGGGIASTTLRHCRLVEISASVVLGVLHIEVVCPKPAGQGHAQSDVGSHVHRLGIFHNDRIFLAAFKDNGSVFIYVRRCRHGAHHGGNVQLHFGIAVAVYLDIQIGLHHDSDGLTLGVNMLFLQGFLARIHGHSIGVCLAIGLAGQSGGLSLSNCLGYFLVNARSGLHLRLAGHNLSRGIRILVLDAVHAIRCHSNLTIHHIGGGVGGIRAAGDLHAIPSCRCILCHDRDCGYTRTSSLYCRIFTDGNFICFLQTGIGIFRYIVNYAAAGHGNTLVPHAAAHCTCSSNRSAGNLSGACAHQHAHAAVGVNIHIVGDGQLAALGVVHAASDIAVGSDVPDQRAAGQADLGSAVISLRIYRTVSAHHGIVICHDHTAAYVQYSLVPIDAETILLRIHISTLYGEAGANRLPIRSLLGKHIDSVAFCGDNRTALQHQITAVLHLNCKAARCALNLAGSIGHGFIVRADYGALSRRLTVPDCKITIHNKRPAIRLPGQIMSVQVQDKRFSRGYHDALRGIL
ncbi:Uncharacterised protein [Flavonifractor plautii]|nr:Uncharacterised protein [Flavonifractor plautii]